MKFTLGVVAGLAVVEMTLASPMMQRGLGKRDDTSCEDDDAPSPYYSPYYGMS